MKARPIKTVIVALAAVLVVPAISAATVCQQMAIPAYFYPGTAWNKAISSSAVDIMVMNPDSGVGSARNRDYVRVVNAARAAGVRVLGYVYTSYGARDLSAVLAEVQAYRDWYGVDGIFLDEVASSAKTIPYYQTIASVIRTAPTGFVMLNPGVFPAEGYMNVADVVLVFEGSYEEYRRLSVPGWVSGYHPNQFYHVVYGVSSATRMRSALSWARSRNAGYVYVTNDVLDNPYDALPGYWSREVTEINASCS